MNILFTIFIYFILSVSTLFMKYASLNESLILKASYYCLSMILLVIFSILWQKLLAKTKLLQAYLFKGTTMFWGIILGYIFFKESVTMPMIVGTIITIFGIYIAIGDPNE